MKYFLYSGTRVPIKNLFDYLLTGESIQTFLADFDGVTNEQVEQVLEIFQRDCDWKAK